MAGSVSSNLQLIACAGAGKTQRVAERIVDQLALDGVSPENVVAFTFNERAAAELKDRIDFKSNDRTQQEEVTSLQLRLYALGYRQATGETPTHVIVDNLDDLDHPKIEE